MRRPARLLMVAAAVLLVWSAGVAAQEHDPDADRTIDVERPTSPLERRIIPFDGALITEGDDQLQVALDADVLFEFDSAELTPQAEATLTELAATIDDRLAGDTVTIVGHTDATGDEAYNLDLSQRRAEAVRDFLQPQLTTAPRLEVEGRGEAEPVAPNDTAEGQRRNRRVEVVFPAEEAAGQPGG